MREVIVAEIKRLAAETNGKPPGRRLFESKTGIRESVWSGVYWARCSDALAEAGCKANELQKRFDSADVLSAVVECCRHYGRLPTVAELQLYRREHPSFPSAKTIANHFPNRDDLITALTRHESDSEAWRDIAAGLPKRSVSVDAKSRRPTSSPAHGFVYLLRSGAHYKIGRSDEIERRINEIRVALPEAVIMIHAIRTDDPVGIEAYWHRRFAARRANGEWFKLSAMDVSAFKRRKDQ